MSRQEHMLIQAHVNICVCGHQSGNHSLVRLFFLALSPTLFFYGTKKKGKKEFVPIILALSHTG